MLIAERNLAMQKTFEDCYGKMGEVNRPHTDRGPEIASSANVGSDKQSLSLYSHNPVTKQTKCALCLLDIEVGYGDQANFGMGNSKPFHSSCLKKSLPHIGILTFNSQKQMFVKVKNDMIEGEEVTYMTQRIVMDGSHRMRVLECLIKNIPIDDACFDRPKKRGRRDGVRREKKMKCEKEVIVV